METHELFTKEPIKAIEYIVLHDAIPLALERLTKNLEKDDSVITKQAIIRNIPSLFSIGMILLRRKDEEGKKLYELFHGCILTAFLNGVEPIFQHDLLYPQDESYDFLIMKYHRDKKPDFKPLPNKEIHKKGSVFKVELAELTKIEDLEKIIIDKSKYIKRILLISVAFHGRIDFQKAFMNAYSINKNNFETIWLIGQTNHPENKNRLCYFMSELVKYKKVFPLFELFVDWHKIKTEVDEALISGLSDSQL
jgi:hypothetical protein